MECTLCGQNITGGFLFLDARKDLTIDLAVPVNSSGGGRAAWTSTSPRGDTDHTGMALEKQFAGDYLILSLKLIGVISLTLVTVGGNILAVLALYLGKGFSRVANALVFNLAVADALIGCLMPVSMITHITGSWPFGEASCRSFLVFSYSLLDVSMFATLLITFDRWWCIQKPFKYRIAQTKHRIVVSILAAWTVAFLLYTPMVILWNRNLGHGMFVVNGICDAPYRHYVPFSFSIAVFEFTVPTIALVFCNLSVYLKIRSRKDTKLRRSVSTLENLNVSSKLNLFEADINDNRPRFSGGSGRRNFALPLRRNTSLDCSIGTNRSLPDPIHRRCSSDLDSPSSGSGHPGSNKTRRVSFDTCVLGDSQRYKRDSRRNSEDIVREMLNRQNKRAARAIGLLLSAFIICWCPYTLLKMVSSFCQPNTVPLIAYRLTEWLCFANSAINPFLHMIANSHIWRRMKRLLRGGNKKSVSLVDIQCKDPVRPTSSPVDNLYCRTVSTNSTSKFTSVKETSIPESPMATEVRSCRTDVDT